MSLERFRRPRMIVLNPSATAYEAARAMAENHIGAVLVGREGQPVGIVTDRDLALEIVAGDLEGRATTLRDVMSDELACVDIGGHLADVVRTMVEHACRRVPVTEAGRPVGLVSLDDLLVEDAIDAPTAAKIIAAQLAAPARFKPEGAIHPEVPARPEMAMGRVGRARTRRRARADAAYARLLRAIELHSGLTSHQHAERAAIIVLGGLCRRVLPDEARDLVAQLPSRLKAELEPYLNGPDRGVTRGSIQTQLARELELDPYAAEIVAGAVGEGLADCISVGEIEELRGQLPLEMKDLLPTPFARAG